MVVYFPMDIRHQISRFERRSPILHILLPATEHTTTVVVVLSYHLAFPIIQAFHEGLELHYYSSQRNFHDPT